MCRLAGYMLTKICSFFFCVIICFLFLFFFFQAEDGIRDLVRSRGLGDVYKRQPFGNVNPGEGKVCAVNLY